MSHRIFSLLALIPLIFLCSTVTAEPRWQPYTLNGPDGQSIEGELGYIQVPANRSKKSAAMLELGFLKLKSQSVNPGNPIVYLSGGPGGSGISTAQYQRYPMFVALTQFADVIILDQRGTGVSRNGLQDCSYQAEFGFDHALDAEGYIEAMKKTASFCRQQWLEQGLDLDGFNTMESAHDLEALRIALNAKQIDLWGISYGTHLAFAMEKTYPDSVGRMILASSEGLDQTVKRPAQVDHVLQRVAQRLKQDNAGQQYPDLLELIEQVHQQYREEPLVTTVKTHDGKSLEIAISTFDIQRMVAGGLLRDPSAIANLPGFYARLAQRDLSMIGPYFLGSRAEMFTLNPMSFAMDAASGISKKRWKLIQKEANESLLWRASNAPFPDINSVLEVKDLGDEFRQHQKSNTPTLFLAGTLDGRTPIEGQLEIARYFSNKHFVTIENGGHNLFMSSPKVLELMRNFLAGEALPDEYSIELPAPGFR